MSGCLNGGQPRPGLATDVAITIDLVTEVGAGIILSTLFNPWLAAALGDTIHLPTYCAQQTAQPPDFIAADFIFPFNLTLMGQWFYYLAWPNL